ncbi:Uncharacterised protein [Orientia tsutsugamushi]|uniref:Uncharacterized protein n=1 Tax=Orientia tsutsugamushi TaxID=784 RepID=A0A2U3RPW6_ORITS|nr:hypothetical protein OTSKARP_0268 [Orientia tsutsugamushi str. Karp]SPR15283.1 Uncharacterised protein [Orientia tsutsugamushi]
MRAINKLLLIKTIFNISHNYNCILSLVYLLYCAFHASSYPKLAFIIIRCSKKVISMTYKDRQNTHKKTMRTAMLYLA